MTAPRRLTLEERIRRHREAVDAELAGSVPRSELDPTPRQLDALVAYVTHGSQKSAAVALGRSEQSVKNTMSELYRRIGANSAPHAVWLLWRSIEYRLPRFGSGDRRMGYERRRDAA